MGSDCYRDWKLLAAIVYPMDNITNFLYLILVTVFADNCIADCNYFHF